VTTEDRPVTPRTEQFWRTLLWQHHGHDGLYGDDGEMQCNHFPPTDFLRGSTDEIAQHLRMTEAAAPRVLSATEALRLLRALVAAGGSEPIRDNHARHMGAWPVAPKRGPRLPQRLRAALIEVIERLDDQFSEDGPDWVYEWHERATRALASPEEES